MILRDCTDIGTANKFAEQLRQKIQALRVKVRSTDKVTDTITASFGLAMAEAGDTFDSLVTRADDALYQAKRNGRKLCPPSTPEAELSA